MLLILAVWKSLPAACFSMEGFGVFLWLRLWILIQSIQHLSSAVKFQQRWSFGVIRRENALKDARVSVERLWNSLCLEPLVSTGNGGFLHDFLTKPYFCFICFMSFTHTCPLPRQICLKLFASFQRLCWQERCSLAKPFFSYANHKRPFGAWPETVPGFSHCESDKNWERWVLRAPTRLIGYNPHAVGWFHPTSYEQHWYSQVLLADGHFWVIELQPLILHGFYQAAAFRSKPAKQEWHFPAKIPIAEPRASQRRPGPKCPLTW